MAREKKKKFVKMKCDVCGKVNYHIHKSAGVEDKLQLKKFCDNCNKHTVHKESKK